MTVDRRQIFHMIPAVLLAGTLPRVAHASLSFDHLACGHSAGAISHSLNLGTIAAPLIIKNQDDPLEVIMRLGQVLDEAYIPNDNRFLLLPRWTTEFFGHGYFSYLHSNPDTLHHGYIDRFSVYNGNMGGMYAIHERYAAKAEITR